MHIYDGVQSDEADDVSYNEKIKNRIKAGDAFEEVKTDDDFLLFGNKPYNTKEKKNVRQFITCLRGRLGLTASLFWKS